MSRPLAIDLFCGLGLKSERFWRANTSIQQLVTSGAQNPDHVALRVGGQSPRSISFESRLVGDLKNPIFSTRLTSFRSFRVSPPKTVYSHVFKCSFGLIYWAALTIFSCRPDSSQLASCAYGATNRAIPTIAIWWPDFKVGATRRAVAAMFSRPLMLVSANATGPLGAVVTTPLLVWTSRLKSDAALSTRQVMHGQILS